MSETPKPREFFLKRAYKFYQEVIFEGKRITWPQKPEIVMTSIYVFLFTCVASVYFFIIDAVIYNTLKLIMGY